MGTGLLLNLHEQGVFESIIASDSRVNLLHHASIYSFINFDVLLRNYNSIAGAKIYIDNKDLDVISDTPLFWRDCSMVKIVTIKDGSFDNVWYVVKFAEKHKVVGMQSSIRGRLESVLADGYSVYTGVKYNVSLNFSVNA